MAPPTLASVQTRLGPITRKVSQALAVAANEAAFRQAGAVDLAVGRMPEGLFKLLKRAGFDVKRVDLSMNNIRFKDKRYKPGMRAPVGCGGHPIRDSGCFITLKFDLATEWWVPSVNADGCDCRSAKKCSLEPVAKDDFSKVFARCIDR